MDVYASPVCDGHLAINASRSFHGGPEKCRRRSALIIAAAAACDDVPPWTRGATPDILLHHWLLPAASHHPAASPHPAASHRFSSSCCCSSPCIILLHYLPACGFVSRWSQMCTNLWAPTIRNPSTWYSRLWSWTVNSTVKLTCFSELWIVLNCEFNCLKGIFVWPKHLFIYKFITRSIPG